MHMTTTRTPEKAAQIERFVRLYERNQSDLVRGIERRVCGCDYGGTSWSTRAEADRLAQLLKLQPGRHLLEVGAGSGWPGLYMARTSQCDVTLTDLHPGSLAMASRRAARDRVEGQSGIHRFAVAEGGALPFPAASFDAIVHSDVLCCLADKAAVLSACRRVIGKDGSMAFTVILTAPGLRGDDLTRAIDAGPGYITTDTEYPEMVRQAGWEIDRIEDFSPQYAETLTRMLAEEAAHGDELATMFGEADLADRLAKRQIGIDTIENGLLRRELFFVRPG